MSALNPNLNAHLPPHESQTLKLPDGRDLGFSTYGPNDAPTIFLFHGFPGSRLDARPLGAVGHSLGARIVGVDRPGFGRSSPQPGRRLRDWPRDVISLADHLGVATFRVLGVSGGGPFALACARWLPPARLAATGVLVGFGPPAAGYAGMRWFQRLQWSLGWWVPWMPRGLMWAVRFVGYYQFTKPVHDPDPTVAEKCVRKDLESLPEAERRTVDGSEMLPYFVDKMREAFRQGSDGYYDEAEILAVD